MAGKLTSDPLFVGLTRPAMIFGVSIHFAILNGLISITWFIQKSELKILFFAAILHLIGYIVCFKEPRFIELYLNKLTRCSDCPNRSYYGANSYSI